MKKYCLLLCLFVLCISSYAQKKEVIVVAVGSESELVGSREREIIMSVFQEKLIENFDVRLTNDDNVYSRYKYYEEIYGESGAIPMDSVLPSGQEAGATYHCLILITKNYEFKANIWCMRDGRATKQMAFYPGLEVSYDKIIRDLKDVKALQIISMRLLKGFGYKVDDNGNMSMVISGTNDPDGKIARENAQRKLEEKKATEEKAEKRRAEKKEAEEKLAEKRAKKEAESAGKFELTFTGSSVESITQIMTERMMSGNTSVSMTSGLDLKV